MCLITILSSRGCTKVNNNNNYVDTCKSVHGRGADLPFLRFGHGPILVQIFGYSALGGLEP